MNNTNYYKQKAEYLKSIGQEQISVDMLALVEIVEEYQEFLKEISKDLNNQSSVIKQFMDFYYE
jgi:hypothetical protein